MPETPNPGRFTATGDDYYRAWLAAGGPDANISAIAREFEVNESTIRRAVKRRQEVEGADPAILQGMAAVGLEQLPGSGWIKSHEPDENGLTYSWHVSTKGAKEAEEREDKLAAIENRFRHTPAVKLKVSNAKPEGKLMGFIPLNDLHAGAYAWAPETGYGDWDIHRAVDRLQSWVGQLVAEMPVCEEVVLFYNGDTLHTNGEEPLTPASKNILDKDGRHFKVADMTATAVIATTDLAAQKHKHVRLVIKRGNHDEDSYLALLLAAKWRYHEQKNVTVDLDPSPYWLYTWGKVMLFGHHGDRVKPEQLIMKLAADHRKAWGNAEHVTVWTAHRHHYERKTFHGARWEQASCLTEPDAHGAYWGGHAEAQAVVYDAEKGERKRITVRP